MAAALDDGHGGDGDSGGDATSGDGAGNGGDERLELSRTWGAGDAANRLLAERHRRPARFPRYAPRLRKFLGDDRGIVQPDLGADSKPVYAPATTSPTTTGKADSTSGTATPPA